MSESDVQDSIDEISLHEYSFSFSLQRIQSTVLWLQEDFYKSIERVMLS